MREKVIYFFFKILRYLNEEKEDIWSWLYIVNYLFLVCDFKFNNCYLFFIY